MYSSVYFSAARRGVFLSQAGPQFGLVLVQAEHHLGCRRQSRPGTKKATRWVALVWLAMRLGS